MTKKEKRKLRKKLAKQVSNKMDHMCTCANERDIILNIILPKKDRYSWTIHCDTDCEDKTCDVKRWLIKV